MATKRKLTDIESILTKLLEDEGFPYVREYRLGTYNVDVYLPCFKLSIQADGGYFHSYCSKCPDYREPTSRQNMRRQKDEACISLHKYYNISILRFCGCELKNEIGMVRENILSAIELIGKGKLVYRRRNLPETD
jgi:very-short-patch-repair endonuclease